MHHYILQYKIMYHTPHQRQAQHFVLRHLLNFSKKYQVSKEKNAKRISEWRDNQAVSENVTSSENVRSSDKVKESKVKESKVKDKRRFIYSLDYERDLLFDKWINYKEEKKSRYTDSGIKQLISKWQDKTNLQLEEAINNSIANNYQGLFEPKQQIDYGNTTEKLGTSAARMEALRKW